MLVKQEIPPRKVKRLLFIYDVNSGTIAAFLDSIRNMLMPGGCALHAITHGLLGEKNTWKACQAKLDVPIDYYHRDDMPETIRDQVENNLPCVVAQTGIGDVRLLSPAALRRCRGDADDLNRRIQYYLAAKNLTR